MTALITGASSGIGLELARICAAGKRDVMLVARSARNLAELAAALEREHDIRAYVVAADLSTGEGVERIVSRVAELRLTVELLVNNAGFGVYGPFVQTPLESELQMIHVNIVALTQLTKRLLPPMLARRSGRILNVASTAAFLPGPLMAVYYATKAYVLSFSEAIANEVAGSGVTVTAFCPGPTQSNFQAVAGLGESKLVFGKTLPSARDVATAGYDGMMAGKPVVIPGISNKVVANAPRLLPRATMAKIVRGAQERRRS
jgi:short-subunit dehydrogenase